MIIWDNGTWAPGGNPVFGLEKGHLPFELHGEKLGGHWHLVRLKPRKGETRVNWLLIKVKDHFSRTDSEVLESEPRSVQSGLLIEEVASGVLSPKVASMVKPDGRRASSEGKQASSEGKQARAKAKHMPSRSKQTEPLQPLPKFLKPCLATLQTKPPTGENWLHEVKFDGYRLQARVDNGAVQLLTRTGLDWTERFGRAIASAFAVLHCSTALIDGEAVVLGDDGVASFSALQDALAGTASIIFYAFDLMHLDGLDLTPRPLAGRKAALSSMLEAVPDDGLLRFSEHFEVPGETMLRHS